MIFLGSSVGVHVYCHTHMFCVSVQNFISCVICTTKVSHSEWVELTPEKQKQRIDEAIGGSISRESVRELVKGLLKE